MENDNEWISEDEYENESNFWEPEDGDELIGTVQRVPTGAYGKKYLIIDDAGGNTWITTQCAAIDYKISKMKIVEDDIVKLIYQGRDEENNNAHLYKMYKKRL